MLREALESETDVPEDGNERFCTSQMHGINKSEKTRGDGVIGVDALSVDSVDRSTRCK